MKNVVCTLLLLVFTGCFNRTASLPVFATLPDPEVQMQSLPAMLRGDYSYKFIYSAVAPDGGKIGSIRVSLSKERGEFKELNDVKMEAGSFTWVTPRADIKIAQLKMVVKNSAGQATESLSNEFEIRASSPRLLMDGSNSEVFTSTNQGVITGSCETGFVVTVSQKSGEEASFDSVVPCVDNRFTLNVSGGSDGSKEFVVRQTDPVGHFSDVPATWTIDSVPPAFDSYLVNNGDGQSITNHLPVQLRATDNRSLVTGFCVKYNQSAKPSLSDECWESPQSVDPAKVTGATLEVENYFKRVGYGRGTYQVSAWVKDGAGNVSERANNSVLYLPHDAPSLTNVYAGNSPTEGLPTREQSFVDPNAPVYIQWKASAPDENPKISLYYTKDGETFTEIVSNLSNEKSGFCGSFSNATGCYVWTNPFPNVPNNPSGDRQFFRIRVAAADSIGSVSYGVSNLVNSKNMQLLAGDTELGLGGTATAAIFSPMGDHALAVHPDGRIFVLDQRGLVMVSPTDGAQKLLVRAYSGAGKAGTVLPNSFATCASCANLRYPTYLTLDAKTNNLLIFDYDRIVRLNTSADPMTLETVIGGGTVSDMTAPVNPLDFQITPTTGFDQTLLASLPNGDMYFFAENYRLTPNENAVLRHFVASENKVKTIRFSGNANVLGRVNATETCKLVKSAFTYDLSTSQITNFINLYQATSVAPNPGCAWYNPLNHNNNFAEFQGYAKIDPATYLPSDQPAPPQLFPEYANKLYWGEMNFKTTTGLDGRLYAHGTTANRGVKKIMVYEEASNTWRKVVGQDYSGNCEDGAPADATCRIEPTSVFVNKQRNVYFIDRNQVRTIQDDGKILTLAGAPRSTPDNGTVAPLDARFGKITGLQMYRTSGGQDRFVVLDQPGFKISEFGENAPVVNVAGNGNEAISSEISPAPLVAASGNPLTWGMDNPAPHMAVDPATGDVYTLRLQGQAPYVIRRSNGLWEKLGNTAAIGGYGPRVQGFHNGKVIVSNLSYCQVRSDLPSAVGGSCDGKLLLYEGTGAPKVMGAASATASVTEGFCADGQNLLDCQGAGGNTTSGSALQPFEDGWLMKKTYALNEKRIVKVVPGGSMQRFATLNGGTYGGFAWDPNKRDIYYCSNGMRLMRHAVPAAPALEPLTDVVVSLPSNKFLCSANGTMIYNPNRGANGSIVFDYTLNNRPGVAEYLIP